MVRRVLEQTGDGWFLFLFLVLSSAQGSARCCFFRTFGADSVLETKVWWNVKSPQSTQPIVRQIYRTYHFVW